MSEITATIGTNLPDIIEEFAALARSTMQLADTLVISERVWKRFFIPLRLPIAGNAKDRRRQARKRQRRLRFIASFPGFTGSAGESDQ